MNKIDLYSKTGFYNKGLAKDFGLIQSVVFQTIMYAINKNENSDKYKGKCFISSEDSKNFLFPELNVTKVFNALNDLRDKDFIILQNRDVKATEKFNYVVLLTARGNSFYESFYKKKQENSEDDE